jgi:hypothetical protein
MDLHVLAKQLSKLKLSQRLFIEEDLLPEDLVCCQLVIIGILLHLSGFQTLET